MLYSKDRILTTHAGALPRPPDLRQMVVAKAAGESYDETAFDAALTEAVTGVVKQQVDIGIDSINDGEFSKINFTNYVRERIGGFEIRDPGEISAYQLDMTSRDRLKFQAYFEAIPPRYSRSNMGVAVCVAPLTYTGAEQLSADLENFRAAVDTARVTEAYLPANTPGTIEHWMPNEYYKSDEEFLFAIAEAMRIEYEAIVDAGFLLQIDDPDLPDGWNCLPGMNVKDYQKYATMRVEALNHGLRNIDPGKVRLHVCWGSFHGPHYDDIALADIIDIIFSVRAMSFSIEASNPCHEHEWNVFESAKLPDGATLIPGVIGHCSDFIEHPDLVAERLVRYANLVGRENVLAGTDCGLGNRVGHESICWAKLESMVEGAKRASNQLW
ncbi:MAG: cobalamin-independent methionine synthase II family protein [Pseudomonadota bacterium]|nr:cobalamin-independent methionine synthase II family protein [Pseudomonadota bacterium]